MGHELLFQGCSGCQPDLCPLQGELSCHPLLSCTVRGGGSYTCPLIAEPTKGGTCHLHATAVTDLHLVVHKPDTAPSSTRYHCTTRGRRRGVPASGVPSLSCTRLCRELLCACAVRSRYLSRWWGKPQESAVPLQERPRSPAPGRAQTRCAQPYAYAHLPVACPSSHSPCQDPPSEQALRLQATALMK